MKPRPCLVHASVARGIMSKTTKEFAEKYIKEELDSRLKYLVGQPDAFCQAYQTALDAMAPKKKCYIFTVEARDAQAYLEPACIPPSDEDECEDEDVEELDEEDTWSDVSGSIIYDRIYADSKKEAVQAFIKKCPQHDIDSFDIETYIAPDDDNTRRKNKVAAKLLKDEMKHRLDVLEGCPDLLYQACGIAIKILEPKRCYLITADTRDAQGFLPPVSDESKEDISEWKEEAMDDWDNWVDVKGVIIYDRIYAKTRKKAINKLLKLYPEYDTSCFGVEEYIMPYCDTEED